MKGISFSVSHAAPENIDVGMPSPPAASVFPYAPVTPYS